MLPFVHFVEKHRGLEFDHPVDVLLLSDEAFERRGGFIGDFGLGYFLSQLASLGLASADDRPADVEGGVVFGYFDLFAEEVVVRGTDLDDPFTRMVLVHELAHALVYEQFGDYTTSDSVGTFALQALIEGDATAVQLEYLASLSPRAQRRIRGTEDAVNAAIDAPVSVPSVIGAAPYSLGAAYVEVLDALGERNDAFRDPPFSDPQILDPLAEAGDVTRPAPLPKLVDGERRRGAQIELGQLYVFFMLATRLDLTTSLQAALGYGRDRSVLFRREGVDCTHLAMQGASGTDTDELLAAFEAWVAARPVGAASVTDRGEDLLVTTCEAPGPVEPVNDLAEAMAYVLIGRLYWSSRALLAEESPSVARCVGDAMALDPEVIEAERRAFFAGRRIRELDDADRVVADRKLAQVSDVCRARD